MKCCKKDDSLWIELIPFAVVIIVGLALIAFTSGKFLPTP